MTAPPHPPGLRVLPSPAAVRGLWLLAGAMFAALALGAPLAPVAALGLGLLGAGLLAAVIDLLRTRRQWLAAPPRLVRELPKALAIGVTRPLPLRLDNPGTQAWSMLLHDEPDARIVFDGLPLAVAVGPGQQAQLAYRVTPRERGMLAFAPATARVRTRWGLLQMVLPLGEAQSIRCLPNFAAVARYAWLAGDRRLAEIGVKSYVRRGSGTDFKQLAEYRAGDPIRLIDWKATLRHTRPVVREYQDERDQSVLFVLDCGRRMRADEGVTTVDGSHFDQALNALVLLAHVALRDGDAVGALTFGTPAGEERRFAPTKGRAALSGLTNALHDLQPGADHPDYLQMARDVMRHQPRRALVVVLTNLRDEDADELLPALRLLRTRHLVLVASLRERALAEIAAQPMARAEQVLEVAAAHAFEQSRRDALRRVAALDALVVDVEPQRLAAELVNRYHALKRSGKL